MMKKLLPFFICGLIFPCIVNAQSEFAFTNFNSTTTPVFGGNNFKCVAVSRTGQIWAGSQYTGLVKYDPSLKTWSASPDLTNVFCADIKADRLEGVWIAQAGTSGQSGGGSNIAGGVNNYPGTDFSGMSFYSITAGGGFTSRNARSIWLDKYHNGPNGKQRVWVAQGTYITFSTTTAGGISVGLNLSQNYFTKVYQGLQVTPYVTAPNAGTPSCLSVAGNRNEVWVFAATNFGKSQILRYRSEGTPGTFLGVYDNTNTAVLTSGFKANAMYFDDEDRAWIGLSSGGIIIKSGGIWKTMNDAAIFPAGTVVNPNAITSDQNGYIYIGTSTGLVIYRTGAFDSASSYRRVTTVDGLPTNNINGVAVDTIGKRIILAHDAGISFMKYNKKMDATLEWDYSFPKPGIKPKGVAADGVSRVYIKVRRNETNSNPIKKITVAIKNLATGASSMVGKLKVASVLDKYSNEANTGTAMEVSRADSTANGDFYFWYVAPDDFSKDSLSKEAQMAEREDSVKVKVTYNDNTEDSSYLAVKIQRPPVMVGGMLGGIKSMLDKMMAPDGPLGKGNIGKILGVQINQMGSLLENVSRLIDGDILQNGDKANSMQGLIDALRNTGFASNRADVIAHGLAGNVFRSVVAVKPGKYLADGNFTYNNYGKGFINKLVSICTPHNGSPLFDLISTIGPRMNEITQKILGDLFKSNPVAALTPYQFLKILEPITGSLGPARELLQKGGIDSVALKLPVTNVKNHLIVSDADATPAKVEQAKTYHGGFLGPVLQHLEIITRDILPKLLKDSMTGLFSSINSETEKILKGLDIFASLKGIANFSGDGDLIAPLLSQTAGQSSFLGNITKVLAGTGSPLSGLLHDSVLTNAFVGNKISQLLNSSILSDLFSNSIPANNTVTPVTNLVDKTTKVLYDTTKIVTDQREVVTNGNLRPLHPGGKSLSLLNDTTVKLTFRIKDTAKLQYVFINFQDTMYTTTSKAKNQEILLRIKKNFQYSGVQELMAVGVYETADSVIYHADTINTYITPPDSIQGFRVTTDEFNLFDGIPYYPSYEALIRGEWQTLPSSDTNIVINIENAAKVAYDTNRLAFDAVDDGFSRAYFSYKTYKDTVSLNCLLPQKLTAVNRTVVNGNFKDSSTWSKGRPPLPGDSIIISAGHTIVIDSSVQVRSLRIDSLGTLTLNNSTKQLQLGDAEDGDFMVDNYGTLNISNGTLTVKGRVKLNRSSSFNMTGGNLVIDGNTGNTITSLQNGLYLFEAAPQMKSFSFTGGTLQIVDPPIGVASQAISCPYNFGINSTLILGNGISLTASNSPGGFGGSQFPPQIGKLILDAGTAGSNRQLTITKPLNVKGSFEIRTGSNLVLQAPVSVTQ